MSKKEVKDLVPDIYKMLEDVIDGTTHEVDDEALAQLGYKIAMKVSNSLTARTGGPSKGVLRASSLGKPCKRQLWYDYNTPELKEKMAPHTLIKFMYGDIIEEILLFLAKEAGHEVTHEQAKVERDLSNGWKVKGNMDAVIDGTTIDVKSASSYGFKKFKEGTLRDDDPFGYIPQLVTYDVLREDQVGDIPGILAMDKTTGQLTYMELSLVDTLKGYEQGVANADATATVLDDLFPPDRPFDPEPHQAGGNEKLCVNCSYCPYKEECWSDANDGKGLRTFLYSNKPVFLTKVVKEPRVLEKKE